jgi:hypothetical protein
MYSLDRCHPLQGASPCRFHYTVYSLAWWRGLIRQSVGIYWSDRSKFYNPHQDTLALLGATYCQRPRFESSAGTASIIHSDVYPERREHSWDGYVRYVQVLISFHFRHWTTCSWLHFSFSSTRSRLRASFLFSHRSFALLNRTRNSCVWRNI